MIKQCNSELQELLNLNCLTTTLYAEGLLTDQEQQELANEASIPCKQNSHFIQKILPFKGEQSFKTFLKVLEIDNQHCGHKELFDYLAKCYTAGARGSEDDSERMNVTKQQLQLILGEVIKDAVHDQLKEVIRLQKRHEEQESNRHKTLTNLINSMFNQLRNNSGQSDTDVDQRRVSVISNATSFASSAGVGSSYSADCEESYTLSIHSGDDSNLADAKPIASSGSLCSPEDEQLVCNK